MRYIETLLKAAFLIIAGYLIGTMNIFSLWLNAFLIVSILLGFVLVFNKKASYNFKQTKRDLMLRRIEGTVLVIVALIGTYCLM